MKMNFSNVDMYDRPILILKKADGTPIGVLGNATDIEVNPNYNELSIMTFSLPASVDGEPTPFYNDVTGQKIIELKGIAQFAVSEPEESGDKINMHKSVKASSLECEFGRKKISLPQSTYKFFDSTNVDGTTLGMIMELMPNWTVGSVASTLRNKYRTFEVSGENLYNFIKGTVQKAYNCIFDFDTLNRVVSVRDADDIPADKQVYISRDNLARDIKVTERTDDLVTRLDVYGADGVDIREVNPTGSNQIINLDYFMNTNYFSQTLVNKYNAWKTLVNNNRSSFYNYAIQYAMRVSEELAENAKLTDLQGEYTSLENIQAVIIQGISTGQKRQADLDTANANLAAKKREIDAKQAEINSIVAERESTMNAMTAIRNQCAYDKYFTLAERKLLDPYIVDNSVEETSFVASEVQSYTDGAGNTIKNKTVTVTGATIETTTNAAGSTLHSIKGGSINVAGLITGTVISAIFERRSNGKIVLSIYVSNGSYSGTSFPSGCISISGTGSVTKSGTTITCSVTDAYLFFSLNASDYEKKTVAWELYEYAEALLAKMAVPTYSFSVDSANFLSLKQFELFKNELELGERIYIQIGSGRILKPVCTGAKFKYFDRPYLELMFSDTFTANDGESKLIEILDNSISMGKTLSSGKFTYEAWTESGASSELHDFIMSALDTAKNAIMSSTEQAVTWDGAGLRLRKYSNDAHTAYEPEQIWINNNSIMMTDSAWATAKMAIGKIHDENVGDKWGIIAEMIVGTLIAGEELVIESQKKDGGTAVFRMDSDGCRLYNSEFTIQKTNSDGSTTQIILDPSVGVAMGTYPVTNRDGSINTTNAKFYVDPSGTMHLAGSIISYDGIIGGWTISQDGLYSGDTNATRVGMTSSGDIRIWAGNLDKTKAPFYVKQDGTIHSTLGQIGGWYIGTDYIGNASTKATSTTGMASGSAASVWTFWAGGAQASAPFRVNTAGKVYCSNIEIVGGSIVIKDGDNAMFTVTNKGKVTAADITITGGSITIKDGNITKFQVTNKGKVTINDGSITIKSGDTTTFSVTDAGYLTSISGKIGGWYIGTDYLGNKSTRATSTVGLYSTETTTNIAIWAGGAQASAPFRVTAGGKIYASNLEVTGGQIGGWYIGTDYIGSANAKNTSKTGMASTTTDAQYAFWAGNSGGDPSGANFRVQANGTVYASNLNITGGSIEIKNGGVTKFKVTNTGKVTADDLEITGGSITLGTVFSVNSSGYLTASSGKIGGWFISSEHIGNAATKAGSSVGLSNVASGNVFWAGTNKFTVTAAGKVTASDLDITGGSINIKDSKGTVTFSVSNAGVLTAKSGSVGGWYFLTDYLGNASTKAGSSVGMAPVGGTSSSYAFWAGGTTPKFYVTGAGKLYAQEAEFTTSMKIGDKTIGNYILEVSPDKISALTFDSLGSASSLLITPTQIKLASTGYLVISSGNFTLDANGNGTIGGWSFNNVQLNSGSGSGYVALNSNNAGWSTSIWNETTGTWGDWPHPYAIWCGSSSAPDAPFRVRRDGIVYIKKLYVDGELIDFTTFENAVSLSSGGSWNGNKFTATVKLWGKINKTVSMSASVEVTSITVDDSMYTDEYAVLNLVMKYTVNGSSKSNISVSFPQVYVRQIAKKGWDLAGGKVSYTSGATSVTVPKTGAASYGDTSSLSIADTYNAGKTAGEGQFTKAALTLQGSSVKVTPTGNAVHFKRHSKDDAAPTGNWYTIVSSGYDLTYYVAGTETTYYKAGTSYTTSNSPYYTKNSSGGCFTAGMMVLMADGQYRNIEEIQTGMFVMSLNEKDGTFVRSEVVATQKFENKNDIYDVYVNGGSVITMTGSHPMLTTEGWKAINVDAAVREHFVQIEKLLVGDIVICDDGQHVIDHIVYRDDLTHETVYNIDVEPYDTYIVNGVVVHNAEVKPE